MSIEIIAAIARGTPGLCPSYEADAAYFGGLPMVYLDDAKARAWGLAQMAIEEAMQ